MAAYHATKKGMAEALTAVLDLPNLPATLEAKVRRALKAAGGVEMSPHDDGSECISPEEYLALKSQRDDLLAALEACRRRLSKWPGDENPETFPEAKAADAAITKTKKTNT